MWLACLAINIYLRLSQNWHSAITIPISVSGCYILFTPLHDAAHASISGKYKWLNEIVGNIAGIPFFFAPFKLFQMIHLKHHAYTNQPDKDPDCGADNQHDFVYFLFNTDIILYVDVYKDSC